MELQRKIEKVTNHVICPRCKEPAGTIDHLKGAGSSAYTWYCDDCGCKYTFRLSGATVLSVTDTGKSKLEPYMLLVETHAPLDKALWIVVQGTALDVLHGSENPISVEDLNHNVYYYSQHTCPTNYLPVAALSQDDDRDPHGVFAFVDMILPETVLEKYREEGDDKVPEDHFDWKDLLDNWVRDESHFHIATAQAVKQYTDREHPSENLMKHWISIFGNDVSRVAQLHRHFNVSGSDDHFAFGDFFDGPTQTFELDLENKTIVFKGEEIMSLENKL